MRCAAGAGDDQLEAGRLGTFGERIEPVRGTVGRDDPRLVVDAQRCQCIGGVAHGSPVRLASHDDGAGGGLILRSSRESRNMGRSIETGPIAARHGKGTAMDYPVLANPGKPISW